MPMKMGIHYKPIGHSYSAFLDSRLRGNDGGMFFPRNRLSGGYAVAFWFMRSRRSAMMVITSMAKLGVCSTRNWKRF